MDLRAVATNALPGPSGTAPALLCLALATLAMAAQGAPPAIPAGKPTPWNAGTAPPPPRPPTSDSTLTLRIYDEDLGRDKLPYRPGRPRRDDPAWATDVSAVMTRCADGNLVITALVIGGQLTPLDNRCPDEWRQDTPAAPGATPQCDAKSWNCSTKPAQ
ncbi:MAG: hypothetical protein JNK40_05035 [Chromatiales bacterium]|nr:hypothetical protein [Chromatiales bacterium]